MATTSTSTVIQLVAGMFAGAPGKLFVDQLVPRLEAEGIQQLAIELGNTPVFESLYPQTDGQAFATAFLTTVIPNFSLDNAAHAWALHWMTDRFDAGIPAGKVVLDALQAAWALPVTDPIWGATVARLNDWTALATRYSVDLGLSSTSVAELQDALHGPVFASADVDGATLTLHYSDLNGLDAAHAPLASAFTVTVQGEARTVSSVAVSAATKSVVLTLSSAVFHGEAVTVAYADPTAGNDANAVQDVVGNDAASLVATAVTNNTELASDDLPPVFESASIEGSFLTLTYADAGALDATHPPAPGDFTVKFDDVAVTVDEVQVSPESRKIFLLLADSATDTQTVTVAYDDPSSHDDDNAIQDTDGNDAASLPETEVTNLSADTTGPVFDSAVVTGKSLVISYTDTSDLRDTSLPLTSAFTVTVNDAPVDVTAVAVDASAKTVTLTLETAASTADVVTLAYTDPTAGDDTKAVQDAAGNDADTLAETVITNNSPDAVAPVFVSAAVSGSTLVLSYSDISSLDASSSHAPLAAAFTVKVDSVSDAVNTVTVNAAAKTVSLTLNTAVTAGQVVTVAYADPTTGNDSRAIQDARGNDAATLTTHAVTNNTGVTDATAPVLSGATVDGKALVMSYIDSSNLDSAHPPLAGAFAVLVDGDAVTVKTVVVNATDHTVSLTLASAVQNGEEVSVTYTDPTAGDDVSAIQDALGNDAATVTTDVVNLTLETTVIVVGASMPMGESIF